MSKKLVMSLMFALGAATACGEGVEFLSLGTAGTGGIYYPLGGAIASRLSVADSMRQYTAEVSGGSVENINRLQSGQMDLAMVIGMTAYQAQRGEGDYEAPVAGLRAIAPLYPNLSHIMVAGDSPAQSVADFGGMRIAVGPPGSGTEQIARHVLGAHGLTYDDVDPRYLSFAEASAALRDGAVDAVIISVGYPAAAVLEATTTGDVRMMGLDDQALQNLFDEYPFYSEAEIPAGAYPGMDEPIKTMGVMNWIVGMDTLDPEVVRILLNIFENDRVSLEQVHDMARQIDLANLERAPIPLHAAAQDWLTNR